MLMCTIFINLFQLILLFLPIVYVAPSIWNVALLHFLKNLALKPPANEGTDEVKVVVVVVIAVVAVVVSFFFDGIKGFDADDLVLLGEDIVNKSFFRFFFVLI